MLVAQFSLLLLVIFVIGCHDYCLATRRPAAGAGRRRQHSVLRRLGDRARRGNRHGEFISMPVTVSLFYPRLVAVMACELSYDVIRALQRSRGSCTRARLGSANSRNASRLPPMPRSLESGNLIRPQNELWVSDKVRQLFQFPPHGEITYREFEQRVHPDDRAARDQVMQRAIRTQRRLRN